ncbi:MAG TPA: hypothetical protein VF056_14885 [Thermoleophilaceae bacterium]
MREPTEHWMLVVIRNPIGAGIGLLALLTFLAMALSTLGEGAGARDGWYRLEVERRAGRISATCGGGPAPGCTDGHWRFEAHGLQASYLLGR